MMQQTFRLRTHEDEFEDMDRTSGRLPGKQRCAAVGLEQSDCQMTRHVRPDGEASAYCYYHDKVQQGFMEPSAPIYPVWPLPEGGYVLLDPAYRVLVA